MNNPNWTLIIAVSILILCSCEGESTKSSSGSSAQRYGESSTQDPMKQPFSQLLVYPKKKDISAFSLVNHQQAVFDQQSLKGQWNLLFMGYTHCPDVCPMTLTDMTQIYRDLPAKTQQKLQIVFLSVDPKRDTPEHISGYVSHFHDDIVGVTGDKDQLDKLVGELGGIYSLNNEDPEYYTVDHTARIFIIDPQGRRFGIVRSEAMQNKDKSKLVEELIRVATS